MPERRNRTAGAVRRRRAATACVVFALLAIAAAQSATVRNTDWIGFGGGSENVRYSPLTQITRENASQLGRLFTVDFRRIDPGIRAGQQSFVSVSGGRIYATTGEGNVFAVNAVNGDVIWRWKPPNIALYRNFGIVANRGVALCDGKVFVLTVDMVIHVLDSGSGRLLQELPIARYVKGASPNYGYSETSASVCANGRLVFGAAGSEYGVRGFVMALRTSDLKPAWPSPFWTIPPDGTSWRRHSTIAGGGVVWTPVTVDRKTNTVYFGTGSATPLYYPELRPGPNPRTNALIAVDLRTGLMKWWQQQMGYNEWAYDTAQPPQVFDGKVGGRTRRVVSVATMEGVWYLYDAATGRPIHQRVKVIDRVEHPRLQAGKPVQIYPSSLGGVNFSPASYHPGTNFILNSAAETAALQTKIRLTPTQKRQKFLLGDVFLGLEVGNFGSVVPGWHDYGSISAINVATGKQVWKFKTPEPGRGGVSTTASGVGFAGGGDGVLRAFDVRNGKVLWTFQTGAQIASGVALYEVAGKQYVAVTVGGTPTSSGGGLVASRLQVFALGGSQQGSPPPPLPLRSRGSVAPAPETAKTIDLASAAEQPAAAAGGSAAGPGGRVRIDTGAPVIVRPWNPSSSNLSNVRGRVLIGGAPVAGARVSVSDYPVPSATRADGSFTYPIDVTVPGRYEVRVVDASRATVRGRAVSAAQRQALGTARGGFRVGFAITSLRATLRSDGILVTGRVADSAGTPPPLTSLYTYQLRGTITDADGKPVQGAVVITRTLDRDFWTFSSASNAQGNYTSFFPASDRAGQSPVPMSVQVAVGETSYAFPFGTNVDFAKLRSSEMNLTLPTRGGRFTLPKPSALDGAVYRGLVVGVSGPGGVVKPLQVRWPDTRGNFSILVPRSLRGRTLSFWQNHRIAFQARAAAPGALIDLRTWPAALSSRVPSGLARIKLP